MPTPPITYTHTASASFLSQFLQTMMALIGIKAKFLNSVQKGKFAYRAAKMPESFARKFNIATSEQHGRPIWTLSPKQKTSETVVLFVHGGAYVSNISAYHWAFVAQMIETTGATIIVPDYPLAPTANCIETFAFMSDLYTDLRRSIAPQNLVFLGDSAGAGLVLGFAQHLRNENLPQPAQLILLSPWLDIRMDNAEMKAVEAHDKMLSIAALQHAGRLYAADLDDKNYRVSPIYGAFEGLGSLSIFIGTHDLFIADCRKLKKILDEKNIAFNYFEYPKMFHDWFIFTYLKEAKSAIAQIAALLANTTAPF